MSFNGVWYHCDACNLVRRPRPRGMRPRGWVATLLPLDPAKGYNEWLHICTRCKQMVKWRDTKWEVPLGTDDSSI